jgi:hypothetical protein
LEDHGAIFNTGTAAGAAILDDTASAFSNFDFEVSGGAFYTFKVRVGDQFDV